MIVEHELAFFASVPQPSDLVVSHSQKRGGTKVGLIKLDHASIGRQKPSAQAAGEPVDTAEVIRHALLIQEKNGTRHILCAENDEERDAWIYALVKRVDELKKDSKAKEKEKAPVSSPVISQPPPAPSEKDSKKKLKKKGFTL